jgi:hypothetical protein
MYKYVVKLLAIPSFDYWKYKTNEVHMQSRVKLDVVEMNQMMMRERQCGCFFKTKMFMSVTIEMVFDLNWD